MSTFLSGMKMEVIRLLIILNLQNNQFPSYKV